MNSQIPMKHRKSLIVIGLVLVFVIVLSVVFQWAITIDFIQSPIEIKTRKAIIYRTESKEYRRAEMKRKAQEGINAIDAFWREYPDEAPKVEERGEKTQILAPTEKDMIMAQTHGEVLWNIYQLETQRGKTDYCRIRGEGYGGFGVMTGGEVVCYPTFEKAVERANYWYGQILVGRTQSEALCKWSGHGDVADCEYNQNFLSMK